MRKMIFLVIMAVTILSLPVFSQTKIKFINNTDKTISAAYAKYIDKYSGWQSVGWWVLQPWGNVTIDIGNYGDKVYIHGMATDGVLWGSGPYKFCVDTENAFTIPNADKDCNGTKRTFSKEFKVVSGKVNTWTFNP